MVIAVVGIGLDGTEGLTPSGRKIVEQATVLAGSKRHLGYFADRNTKKLDLTSLQTGLDEIAQLDLTVEKVVILASGDPLFFGLGRLLLTKFNPSEIEFHPHLTSVQLAFNRLKIPWQNVSLVSVHGRSNDELVKLFKQGKDKIAVLTDGNNNPAAIARLWRSLELPLNYSFYICADLGAATEKISHFSSQQIAQLSELTGDDFAALNVLILVREAATEALNLDDLPLIGISDRSFLSFRDRPGLITKREVRLEILGELALQPQQTVWDIGAGTGSVSIEIARLCPTSQVYAIEKTSIGSSLVTQNSARFQVDNITSVNGQAPDVLLDLPNCDRIFIGGSGGNIASILTTCSHKLKPQGRIVMSFATIEYQLQAISWLSEHNWRYRLLQLQISRSTPVNYLTRLTPLNPVTIITASK
ncbi:MAG: precorrin-6y C5,15-methyltransferase (decarboxylating) subunit CbiE [Cyanobacteria bacterium J06621_12]